MIFYEVTLQVEPALAPNVEEHMRQAHIPAQADLDRYLRDHAPRFRAEFRARFPSGVTAMRETWLQLGSWQ